jgi:putative oxidoreductase
MRRLLYPELASRPLSVGLLRLRLVAGIAFLYHGWPKIQNPMGWMGENAATPPPLAMLVPGLTHGPSRDRVITPL